jgi:hypothetical protein
MSRREQEFHLGDEVRLCELLAVKEWKCISSPLWEAAVVAWSQRDSLPPSFSYYEKMKLDNALNVQTIKFGLRAQGLVGLQLGRCAFCALTLMFGASCGDFSSTHFTYSHRINNAFATTKLLYK